MNNLDKNIHATIISNWEKDENAGALKPNFYSIHGCAIHFSGIVKYTKTNILIDGGDRHSQFHDRQLLNELLLLELICILHA